MPSKVERYEKHRPGVDIPDAQKEARAELLAFKDERRQHKRTNRTRGIVVPRLPYLEREET